jgi:hypothetical protein
MAIDSFSLTYTCKSGDTIAIWGHSPGVTYEDWLNNPSVDPYFVYQEFVASNVIEGAAYAVSFSYDTERGYIAAIYVNNIRVADENIEAVLPDPPKISSTTSGYTSITVYIDNCYSSDSVSGTIGYMSGTVSYYTGGTCAVRFNGLSANTTYTVRITINGSTTTLPISTQAYPTFNWDTHIASNVEMGTYVKDNKQYPAPVTAEEWNRLVDLINLKYGNLLSHVSSGDEMVAGPGGNIRLVADALGVSVASGDRITAQFFLDLRTAVNK